ncbi:MAG TPA: hypothetical protein VF551_00875 [Chthoniobacterales bacterium]
MARPTNGARPTRIRVTFLDRTKAPARADQSVAAWICKCGDQVPLIGRCAERSVETVVTICPVCQRKYRVDGARTSEARANEAATIEEIA